MIAGASESFPKASITFDHFHVVKLLLDDMNKVRIDERKEHAALKNHKYTFLKNKAALSDKKRQVLEEMITLYPTLGVAYRLKSLFNDLWTMSGKPAADTFLNDWCAQVWKAKI
ncbi:MAG: transposase [Nitrosomonas sp.]|nr:transposase [Nitrosomonas sp.]